MGADDLRVICGPTAAGKSALALRMANRYGAAIVSADSRQIYRGFNIGTAKPTISERVAVRHYGIDVAEPIERYSAARWAAAANEWIAHAAADGRAPLVVGGTGFYLRALANPLFAEPQMDSERRYKLQAVLAALPLDELRRWTRALDPERSALGRTQLSRAVEVALLTGTRISDLHRDPKRPGGPRLRYLVADPGAPLQRFIERRVDAMIGAGWEDEVRRLVSTVPAGAPAWGASGYRAMLDRVSGASTTAQARERIIVETRQYAKRQRTWFRHQLHGGHVTRMDPLANDMEARLDAWWAGGTE